MAKKSKTSKATPTGGAKGNQKAAAASSSTSKQAASNDAVAPTTNRPRNILVTDATQPFTFSFVGRFGIFHTLTVDQTPDDDTWPGGALWDLGVLLSQILVAFTGTGTVTTATQEETGKLKGTNRAITLPSRIHEALDVRIKAMQDTAVVLELGCGVGLTGLVAAAALGAKCTALTDLQVVIDRVTEPNVLQNTVSSSGSNSSSSSASCAKPRTINKGNGTVVATPLCWGSQDDEVAVKALLESLATAAPSTKGQSRRKKKGAASSSKAPHPQEPSLSRQPGVPDMILIGDVAYQHKPGAPSHFEVLMSTLLKFVDEHTIVIFGTRIRMPASVDLLDMFLEHFDELVTPALRADEIDSSFAGVKHNMTIHFLQRKKGVTIV